jgi:hypothetical protein
MSEAEVRLALMGWQAGEAMTKLLPAEYSDLERGRAEGYVAALEMVLRG